MDDLVDICDRNPETYQDMGPVSRLLQKIPCAASDDLLADSPHHCFHFRKFGHVHIVLSVRDSEDAACLRGVRPKCNLIDLSDQQKRQSQGVPNTCEPVEMREYS